MASTRFGLGPEAEDDQESTVMVEVLASGSFFADRFRVGPPLGVGAMGRVVQAHDLVSGHDVALKVLHRERARDAETIERFRREAAILESIGHPAIVRVLAMGEAFGVPWLALELVRGETLKERLRRGPMHPHEVVPVLNTLCDALAAAHMRGVVHRDLKPDNVLLVTGGYPPCKIVDFGLSSFTAAKTLTQTGSILGTPRYMAPEQIKSARDSDPRVDVFAVGVLIYEMLTGVSPYPAEDMGQLLGCVLEGRVVPLAHRRPDLPPAVGAVIERAMARDRAQRFQTAGAVAEAYANAIGVRSGRSQLDMPAPELATPAPHHREGAAPLVDPFGASQPIAARPESDRPAALAADVREGELSSHPLLATIAPRRESAIPATRMHLEEVAPPPAARASAPGVPAEFTRPSRPTPAPAPVAARPAPASRPKPARSRGGWLLFGVALVAVTIVATGAGLALRMWTSGTLRVPAAAITTP
ncbi:serine/threonine-protein kinase [Sandaracinus amylolyticus]|uniref:serine/threonine-protein kinase n=1 Tax=Sandaracinus amylolyticus TaxID=927083 RepID=UPI001F20948C|nr:serine/threonine-protein kinase [Sandaracinus amylolyticus]